MAPAALAIADLYVVGGEGALEHGIGDALRLTRFLRRAGLSVDYALSAERYQTQTWRNQMDSAKKSGARAAAYFASGTELCVHGLSGKMNDAPQQRFPAQPLLSGDERAIGALTTWFRATFPTPQTA